MLKAKLNLVSQVIRNPRNMREITHYICNDINTLRGVYHYRHPLIFISGLPKSGTTWLRSMLAMIPGYNIRPVYDSTGSLNRNDITDGVFKSLPKHRFSIIKTHTKYSDENFRIITNHVNKFIVMIRDLRDMCVSRYFHIRNDNTHPLYEEYNNISTDDGIMHSIRFVHKRHVPWIEHWTGAFQQHPDKILMIRYEQLNKTLEDTLNTVFKFYDLTVDQLIVEKLLKTQLKTESNIQENLVRTHQSVGRLKSTARRGVIGDWRNHFNDEHIEEFKNLIGDDLIRWGYAKDKNW